MESKLKPWELVAIPLLLALLNLQNLASAVPQVPSYFIFGDSISDSGNNNKLAKLAKVNYPPYGIDFPEGPTGRYSNGRTVHDFIDYMLPFAESNEKNIFNGVNYASGATGIRDETGQHRIKNHKTIISRITSLMRNDSATKSLLSQCIYSIQIGSNGYLNNYFMSELYDTRLYSQCGYATLLVQQLSDQLKVIDIHFSTTQANAPPT
ncbi:hypothetical protein V6N12_034126 [Hibiscus sabdariffa]|uniref:GDSL esterase/lipase n=1 Tax=Hibiscus sabdariffa TaxID=183260 RepID=A0ABR2BIX3_9ROSI